MNKFQRTLFKLTFSSDDRVDIYDNIRQYLLDGIGIEATFDKMIVSYTRRGRQPNNPIGLILQECSENLARGFTLSESLSEWIPEQELSVIEACDVAGRAEEGFLNAIRIAEGADKIRKSIKATVMVSSYLMTLMLGIISLMCVLLVPILQQSVPLAQWSPAQKIIYYLYIFISEYSLVAISIIAVLILIIVKTLPRWTGDYRFYFDKIPPYSLYKKLYGSTFIINVDAMLSSGISIEDALNKISDSSNSAWLQEKIQATLNAIKSGEGNLGTALDITGYEFPSVEAIIKMQSLFETRNKEGSLKRFGDKWLDKTIEGVEKTGDKIKLISMLGSGLGLCAIIAIMFDLIRKAFNI